VYVTLYDGSMFTDVFVADKDPWYEFQKYGKIEARRVKTVAPYKAGSGADGELGQADCALCRHYYHGRELEKMQEIHEKLICRRCARTIVDELARRLR